MDIKDLRSSDRFVSIEPLVGSFGSASVTIRDLSIQGAQIEHAQPLRLGTRGRFWFRRGDVAVSAQAITIWSHLSKTPNEKGKFLYLSGLRIDEGASDFANALQSLLEDGVIRREADSLEKKRLRMVNRLVEKSSRGNVRVLRSEPDVNPDQVLLVQHARERLLADPLEAQRWYQRAKYAITHGQTDIAVEAIRNREDVLAVWEYLERTIEVSTIVRVFERMRTQ